MVVMSPEVSRNVFSIPDNLSVPSLKYFITIQGQAQAHAHGLAYM